MFNEISFEGTCPHCGAKQSATAQFRYGNLRGNCYSVGDAVQWGSPENGRESIPHAAAEGTVTCSHCQFDGWRVDVLVADGAFAAVRSPSRLSYPGELFVELPAEGPENV